MLRLPELVQWDRFRFRLRPGLLPKAIALLQTVLGEALGSNLNVKRPDEFG